MYTIKKVSTYVGVCVCDGTWTYNAPHMLDWAVGSSLMPSKVNGSLGEARDGPQCDSLLVDCSGLAA